jgi:hypothetical protein
MHSSGEKLHMYTGIAAILRFPLPDHNFHEVGLQSESQSFLNNEEVSASKIDEIETLDDLFGF